MNFDKFRYNVVHCLLDGWNVYKITGNDRVQYLNGQTTNDVNKQEIESFLLNSHLNKSGQLQSFFFVLKNESYLYLLFPKEIDAQSSVEMIMQNAIMDEVECELIDRTLHLYLSPFTFTQKYIGSFYGEQAIICEEEMQFNEILEIEQSELEGLRLLNGFPKWNKEVQKDVLVNQTILCELAVNLQKGCFLGQETVGKIESHRGAAYYPCCLEVIDGKSYQIGSLTKNDSKVGKVFSQFEKFLYCELKREFRIEESTETFELNGSYIKVKVHAFPFFKDQTVEEKSLSCFHKGVENFQQDEVEESIKWFNKAININPKNTDAYESLGVVLGRQGDHQKAIDLMDKLLDIDPNSVMAHTNKSLYYMKMGNIEEAEKEKSAATLKSFKYFGDEAAKKKQAQEEKNNKMQELMQRESMFKQVLEIDPEDILANYGIGEIELEKGNFDVSVDYLKKVLEYDEKYSVAYLALGKAYEGMDDSENARTTYEKGIKIAAKKGDLMPANEMQRRLVVLT